LPPLLPPPAASSASPATEILVECKWDSVDEGNGVLEFEEGHQIRVLAMPSEDEWYGENVKTGQKGTFPAAYVDTAKSSKEALEAMESAAKQKSVAKAMDVEAPPRAAAGAVDAPAVDAAAGALDMEVTAGN
jgi:hypothetical protein